MHDEKLSQVLCETAEQMFFQEFVDKKGAEVPEKVFWATVAVHSPDHFEVVVAANDQELRENMGMMFQDDDISDAQVSDMVAELANTIAGSLARTLSDDSELSLSPPSKGLGEAPSAEQYHGFTGDDLTLFVAVRDLGSAAE